MRRSSTHSPSLFLLSLCLYQSSGARPRPSKPSRQSSTAGFNPSRTSASAFGGSFANASLGFQQQPPQATSRPTYRRSFSSAFERAASSIPNLTSSYPLPTSSPYNFSSGFYPSPSFSASPRQPAASMSNGFVRYATAADPLSADSYQPSAAGFVPDSEQPD